MQLSQNHNPHKRLTKDEVDELVLQEYLRRRLIKKDRSSFLKFVEHVCPWFIVEEIHILIADRLEKVVRGEIDRLIVNLPPRAGKSLLASQLFPAFYIGHHPSEQLMQISYKSELAEIFGRDVRNRLLDDDYQEFFPETQLTKDSKAAAKWATTAGGKYSAAGVTGGIAGRGYNLGCIDDPLSEQDAFSPVAKNRVWEWYGPGFYTRRQPEKNAIVLIMTRWAPDDLAGHLLADAKLNPDADKWEVLSIPAVLDQETAELLNSVNTHPLLTPTEDGKPIHFKAGDSFAPRRWPLEELMRTKGNMTKKVWASLYQQSPYVEDGGILPAESWRKWKGSSPPSCLYILQSYDTAFEEDQTSDYTVRTTWGIFRNPEGKLSCILLERLKKRLSFPELREEAWESYREYDPDRVIIEKKASGHSLIQELRKKGVPISSIKVDKSKFVRAHAASIVLEMGCVYYMDRNWAQEIIDECAQFPSGLHDDAVDSCTQAWTFLRRQFHLELADEEEAEETETPTRRLYG